MRILLLSALLLLFPLVTHASFVDVPEWHAYEYAISEMQLRGVVTGYSDGTFKPNASLNRAEFVTMVIRSLYDDNATWAGCPNESKVRGVAPDVARDSWYEISVCFAKEKGIMQGYPDGLFRPEQTINVAEASAIVARAFQLQYEEQVDAWYRGPMIALGDKGALPISMVSMADPVRRFELAGMLYPLLTGDETTRPSFTYDDFIGTGHDASRYEGMQKNIRAAYDQQVTAGTLRDYSDARFDGCGAVSSYVEMPWYANLSNKLDAYPKTFWEKERTFEGCYAADAQLFVFVGPSDYCTPGSVFRYDIQSGQLSEASVNWHSSSRCQPTIGTFGKRVGTTIPMMGGFGDAGCSSTDYYTYDFVKNHVNYDKSASRCQGEQDTWIYY